MQEECGVADFSEADRDDMEAREDFCSMSGEFIYRHHVMFREHLHVPKESSFAIPFQYIEARDANENNGGHFGREQYR